VIGAVPAVASPEGVAVAGFDDSCIAAACHPPLTTIRQPWARISTEMARLLPRLVDGDENAAVILPTELVIRESA
jgi:DNA-binding LacI/PurR family transcriptional regulator